MIIKTNNKTYVTKYDIGDKFIIIINGNEVELVIHNLSMNLRSKKYAERLECEECDIEFHLHRENTNGKMVWLMTVDEEYLSTKLKLMKKGCD